MKTFKDKICPVCGINFTPKGAAQKYCHDCAPKVQRQQSLESYHRKKGLPVKKMDCKKVAKSLDDTNQKAKAAGMSYGMYVAKKKGDYRLEIL